MKLGTLRLDTGTRAVRIDEAFAVETDFDDVGTLLSTLNWRERAGAAAGPVHALDTIIPTQWAPVVPSPSKIICVGLNYAQHILEMGRELPDYPTLFPKYAEALIGAYDTIVVPDYASSEVDWEGELAVVIGTTAHRVSADDAEAHVAGYSIMNDVTMRDFQYRTTQWLQGKTFARSAPFGPWLVTPDEFSSSAEVRTSVDGETKQQALIADLVFPATELISYVSHIVPLNPGDVIATGTPGGVGHAREPREYLVNGSRVEVTITGLGRQANVVVVQ